MVQYVSRADAEEITRDYGALYLFTPKELGLGSLGFLVMKLLPEKRTRQHCHTYEEVFYLLKGEVVVHCKDRDIALVPGSAAVVPKGEAHCVENVSTAQSSEVVIAISPPRWRSEVTYFEGVDG